MNSCAKRCKFYGVLFAVMFVAALLVAIYYCNLKTGFHVDELWTFGLSNSFYFPHIFWENNMDANWMDPTFIQSYLTVDTGHVFRFDSVLYNLSNDAHPPLYFFIIHTVCSLFPNEFSKWFGLVPNLCFYSLSLVFLFKLSYKVFQSKPVALILMALWAFCPIALNLVTYIRMYLLLVTLALAFLDALFDMFNASFANRSVYFRLFVISLLGFLTHFYFYIYLFFVSCFFTIYFWARKGWRFSFKYGVTIVLSVCLSFIIFPPALSNMFGNHYVESASSQSGVMVLLRRIWQFLGSSSVDLFFGSRLLLIACFCLSIALCFYLLWNKKINREHPESIYIVLLFNSSLVFYVTACYVSPFTSSRYICLAYPGLLLFGFGMFLYLFRYLQIRYRKNTGFNFRGTILVSVVFVCAIIAADSVFFSSNALYLYPKSADNEAAVEKYAGSTGLFVSYDYYQLTAKLLEVAKLSRIHALIPDQKAISSFCDRNYIDSDDLVVYMNNHDCEEEVLSQLKDELGYSGFKKLPGYTQIDDGTSCFVYVLYR